MSAAVEVFFLPVEPGQRFAIFHPAATEEPRGAILYVHPFAEEMNKSRRMAALQARAFAQAGFAVLQLDLFGCGDSSGDFGEATWQHWLADLAAGAHWLRGRCMAAPLHLWGLRLGALLALDFLRETKLSFAGALLWQLPLSGEILATQFLRLELAGEALREGKGGITTGDLRRRITAGEALEIAGYQLNPALLHSMDGLRASDLAPAVPRVLWLDVRSNEERGLAPAAEKLLYSWKAKGIAIEHETVAGEPFWTTQEIVELPQLVAATIAHFLSRNP
jgi:exosortase A-associated hydrolase 2